MPLYAVENLDDALDATRELLLPVSVGRWLRLAVVVFFVGLGGGGGANFPTSGFQFTGGGTPPAGQPGPGPGMAADEFARFLEANLGTVLLVVGGLVLLSLAFAALASIMEFAFVESLRSEEVHVRRYVRRYWRQGLRLFGFRLVVGLLAGVAIAGLVVVALAPLFLDAGAVSAVAVLLAVPAVFVLALVAGLVYGFTTVFVVPVMLLEDCGVLAAWRKLWPTITGQWKQYLAYAVAGFVLTVAAGFVFALAMIVPAILLLVPFGVLFAIVFLLGGGAVGAAVVAVIAVVLGFLFVVAAALVQVPIQTYLRYYALLVLGDVDERFDVIPERRAAIRE